MTRPQCRKVDAVSLADPLLRQCDAAQAADAV